MIPSYYASYALQYYDEGKVYSFYMRKGENDILSAQDEFVKKHSKALAGLEKDTDTYPPAGLFSICQRACGVVVEKIPGDGKGIFDKLRVMFKVGDNEYGEKLYVVNYSGGAESDGWEALPVQTELKNGTFYPIPTKSSIVRTPGGTTGPTLDTGTGETGPTIDEDKIPPIKPGESKPESMTGSTSNRMSGETGPTIDEKQTGPTIDVD